MNKIRFVANKDTNYVFNMLSVAKCGYDNEYGEGCRSRYCAEDLSVLKRSENLLTVCGGQHCGALFGLIVARPACGYLSAKEYYGKLIEKSNEVLAGNISEDTDKLLIRYAGPIIEISEVMVKYYDDYVANIWEREKAKIDRYIPELSERFENSLFTENAEKLVGYSLEGYFTATLVTSVEGGAEAIDISNEQDVFGIERTHTDAYYFIGHEFIIYLLMRALSGLNAFKSFETWALTEGLAEYYLKKITGDTRFFNEQQKYVKYYEELSGSKPMSAAELYNEGLKRFIDKKNS